MPIHHNVGDLFLYHNIMNVCFYCTSDNMVKKKAFTDRLHENLNIIFAHYNKVLYKETININERESTAIENLKCSRCQSLFAEQLKYF